MAEVIDILGRIWGIAERVSQRETLNTVQMGIFGALAVFGILNCILGYRLLRFWVMLFGFAAGAFAGLFLVKSMDITDKTIYLGAMLGLGIAVGILSFLIYKVGIFILGAGIAWTLTIYVFHPTTSAVFFACILCGVAVGSLGVRFAKEVIIVGTSLLGGAVSGFAISKLGGLAEIPYGIGMSVGFALLGLLIQFAINRSPDEEKEEADRDDPDRRRTLRSDADDLYDSGDEELYDDLYDAPEKPQVRSARKRRKGNVPDILLDKPDKRSSGY